MRLHPHHLLLALCISLCALSAGVLGASQPPHSPSTSSQPTSGIFLLAPRDMLDPNFHRSVVFLLRHDQKGSLGLVVNRSESVKLSEALPNIDIAENSPHRVTLGGPVAVGHALFLARSAAPLDQAQHVIGDIYYSGNGELLKRLLAKGTPESELRVYAGHAGWAEGQLASEIARGGWHVVRADPDAIFSVNTKSLWENLIERHDPQGLLVRNLRRLPP